MPLKPSLFFRHKRKQTPYLLLTLANVSSEDPKKFPELAVYVDVEARVWARPLTEFQNNFRRDTEMTDEYFAQLYQEAERRLERVDHLLIEAEKQHIKASEENDSKT